MTVTDEAKPLMLAPAADPAPLGLAAFALTTFLLSAANAKWMNSATGSAWLGFGSAPASALPPCRSAPDHVDAPSTGGST